MTVASYFINTFQFPLCIAVHAVLSDVALLYQVREQLAQWVTCLLRASSASFSAFLTSRNSRTVISSTVFTSPVDGMACGFSRASSGSDAIRYNALSPKLRYVSEFEPISLATFIILFATSQFIPIDFNHFPNCP